MIRNRILLLGVGIGLFATLAVLTARYVAAVQGAGPGHYVVAAQGAVRCVPVVQGAGHYAAVVTGVVRYAAQGCG